jgi:hypothetical protein
MSFPEKHPWMTFFIALFSIGAVVSIAEAASPVATKLAGAPKLPPKPAGT